MNALRPCPNCGSRAADEGPAGNCPNCLFALAAALGSTGEPSGKPPGLPPSARGPSATIPPETSPRVLHDFGDYQLLEEIARGGMGIVYRARQVSLNRIVAVKVLLFGQFASDEFVRRFRKEAEAAANLHHPNIVAIHEIGEHEGRPYFSMDYVPGGHLGDFVRQQPLPAKRAGTLLKTIAEAVHHAHRRGVLHRDLKPSNVLIDAEGQPRLTDFGLAKRFDADPPHPARDPHRGERGPGLPGPEESRSGGTSAAAELTITGQVLGTPAYASPEQLGGRHRTMTTASDVYSLGAILYFLLTDRPPFHGESLDETLHQVLHQEPVSPRLLNPSVPRDLETICLKCLAKEPRKRYASAQSLADELERFLNDRPILARPTGLPEKLWRWYRRRPALAALIVALLVVGSAGLAGILWQWARAKHAAQEARTAQRETITNLWNSYLAQARANRRSGQPGQRFATLDVIAKAAAIRSSPELRDETVAALTLVDARRVLVRADADAEPIITAFDAERRRYAAALANGEISIRSVEDGLEQFRLPAVGAPVAGVERFTADGRRLLVVYGDNQARVWDLAERRVRLVVPTAIAAVSFSVTLTEDGRFLAATDGSQTLSWFDVDTGAKLARLTAQHPVTMVRVTPQKDRLAAAGLGGEMVEIFALPSGARLASFMHPPAVRKVIWDPEGRLLATIGSDREIRIWDVETGTERRRLIGHNEDIEDVVFAPSERAVISSGWDGTSLWNHETSERLLTLPEPGARVTLSEDGRRFYRQAFGSLTYECWELAVGTPFRSYGSTQRRNPAGFHARASAFSRDGQLLANADTDQLRVFDPFTGRELGAGHLPPTAGLAFDDGLNMWASGTEGLKFIPRQRESSNQVLVFGPPESIGPAEPMERLRLSADGATLAVGADDRFRVFDVRTRREIFATPMGSGMSFLALNSDGSRLATCAWGGRDVQIWDPKAGRLLTRLQADSGVVESADVAFSPDGQRLLTVGMGGCAMWEVGSWARLWTRPRGDLPFAMFSSDGAYVLQRARKSFLEVLAVDTGKLLGQLEMPRHDHPDGAGASFSPEGNFFAVHPASTHELWVWHLAEVRRELAQLGLDWELPPLSKATPKQATPTAVRFVSGSNSSSQVSPDK